MSEKNTQSDGQSLPAENTASEVIKNPVTIAEEIKERREVIKEAMSKIRSLFEAKTINIQTNRAEVSEIAILGLLTSPLGEISEKWREEIEKAGNDDAEKAEINDKNKKRTEELIEITDAYLNKMTAATGFLIPEIMVKIQTDLNKKAANYADLLESEENRDVLEAYKWSIGAVGVAARPKAIETLKKRIPEELKKGDRGLMSVLWSILAQLNKTERIKVVQECSGSIPDLNDFVIRGNSRGVFAVDEMEELLSRQFSKEERESYATAWTVINDKRKETLALTMSSYGAENPANRMLTLGNLGLTFLQFVAGTTIVGNIITDVFQSGKPKSFEGIVKAIIKPHNLIAGGALAGINIYRNGSTWKQKLESKGSIETHREDMALTRLSDFMNSNAALWTDYDEALSIHECEGIKALSDYVREFKKVYEREELEQDIAEYFDFSDYLARKEKEKKTEKNLDYGKLQELFGKFKNKNKIFELAQIFDSLNFGGAVTADEFHKLLSRARNYPENP